MLPVPYGDVGALSPDGTAIAYTTRDRGFRTWKRFRGGTAPDIWLLNLDILEAQNLTDDAANDSRPMWHGSTLYFLSDRGPSLRANIWALDTTSGEMRQVPLDSRATIGQVGNTDAELVKIGKAGRNRWKGKRPQSRGVVMNPVDHPLGGGEGKSSGGRHPTSPWGKPEGRTRKKNKASDKYIVRRRSKKGRR